MQFIAMSDGVRLAASLYVPDGDGPWPAVLEALPYRKDDDTAAYRSEYERLRRRRLRGVSRRPARNRAPRRASRRTSTRPSSAPTC